MTRDELIAGIESKLRGLRSCDTQATAIAWMSGAYKLMEECVGQLRDLPAPEIRERVVEKLIFVPERPKLQIVQSLPPIAHIAKPPRFVEKTVVYPEMYLHPGLKPAPKAWTHSDTLKLENAAKLRKALIQRRGQ